MNRLALCALVPAVLAPLLAAGDGPALFYSKSFPKSQPEYMEIRLQRDGWFEYREAPNEEEPLRLKLTQEQVDEVFALADRLDHLQRNIESGLPVARMGEKTIRWQQGTESHQQSFNYSTDPDAQALHDWFEKMCESAIRFIDLERAARFDHLGVNKSILLVEVAWDNGRLVGLEQFLPLLDRIAKNETYMNMSRERAGRLAATFRDPPARPRADQNKEKGK
jgi:hypothetical protein